MATCKLDYLATEEQECLRILKTYHSIRVSMSFLLEWWSVQQQKKVISQESVDAFTLDILQTKTSAWSNTWKFLNKQIEEKRQHGNLSGLSFLRVKEVSLNWLPFQKWTTCKESGATGVDNSKRAGARAAFGSKRLKGERNPSLYEHLFIYLLHSSFLLCKGEKLPHLEETCLQHLRKFVSEFELESILHSTANINNISELCSQLNNISVVVYSKRKTIIFKKIVENESFQCLLYWNDQKMLLIKNLKNFLGTKSIKQYCSNCERMHNLYDGCKEDNTQLGQFVAPSDRDGEMLVLTMYSDIKAFHPPNERQYVCCFSLITAVLDNIQIKEHIIQPEAEKADLEDAENALIFKLLFEIEQSIANFHGWTSNRQKAYKNLCHFCTEYRTCMSLRKVIVSIEDKCSETKYMVCKQCYWKISIKRLFQPVVFIHNFGNNKLYSIIRTIACEYNFKLTGRSTESVSNLYCSRKGGFMDFCIRDSMNLIPGAVKSFADNISPEKWQSYPESTPYFHLFEGQNGEFAYDWLQNRNQLLEQFPDDNEERINELSGKSVKLSDLRKRNIVFRFETVGEYLKKYCTMDVLSLFFYFNMYQRAIFEEYMVDIAQFSSMPSLSWYITMHQETNCWIPNSKSDYLEIQDNIRGGIVQARLRYASIKDKEKQCIKMLTINTLYSWCMKQKLPTEFLGSIDVSIELDWLDLLSYRPKDETWLCTVDLEYPQKLHDLHQHFYLPLAPHHYNNKLCTTLCKKERYMVLDELLLFYLSKGLIITKWHRIQRWRKRAIFQKYVTSNIEARNDSTDETVRAARVLANNSLFGKTCENAQRYKKFIVTRYEKTPDCNGRINKNAGDWENFNLLDSEYIIAQKSIDSVILNKPIQLGFAILEFAKLRLYSFWHHLVDVFGENVKLLYTDTDYLLLFFNHPNPFEIMRNNDLLKTYVDIPKSENGEGFPTLKETGLFSDQFYNRRIISYIGLRAKKYIIKFDDNTVDQQLSFEHFKNALFQNKNISRRNHGPKHMYNNDLILGTPLGYNGQKYLK